MNKMTNFSSFILHPSSFITKFMRLSTKLSVTVMFAVGVPVLAFSFFLNQDAAFSTEMLIGANVAFMFLIGGLMGFLTERFTHEVEEAIRAANEIAQGKLDVEIANRGNNETRQLASSINALAAYLKEVSQTADQIAAGKLNVKFEPRSSEDLFGASFKNMLERASRLAQTKDERDRLQRSIMKLLDEVADVANGDLTAKAEVTSDATGAIADAFNYMIGELRGIISQVKQTSQQVDSSAALMQTTTENLMRRSEQQASQLNELSGALEEMANAMQSVVQETGSSVRVSDDALANAKQGNSAIQNNIAAMNRLRSRVQDTAERIKRLGERSQEISAIVKIINDLAQRTSVLALNASIQAAAAGQQGRGFVAVAEEVERLAERSAVASKQIDALTKAIQGETNEAVESMETTVKEVAIGVKLTSEVGETLSEIESVTEKLAQISQTIAVAARRQAQTSADISGTMRVVAGTSQATAAGMKESAATVNQLALWAQNLRGSVASFRLPERDETEAAKTLSSASNRAGAVSVI